MLVGIGGGRGDRRDVCRGRPRPMDPCTHRPTNTNPSTPNNRPQPPNHRYHPPHPHVESNSLLSNPIFPRGDSNPLPPNRCPRSPLTAPTLSITSIPTTLHPRLYRPMISGGHISPVLFPLSPPPLPPMAVMTKIWKVVGVVNWGEVGARR